MAVCCEDLRLSTVHEFRGRVKFCSTLLRHPCQVVRRNALNLSKVSDPAPLVEAEVPDLPSPLFLTNETLLLTFPWLSRDPQMIRCLRPTTCNFRKLWSQTASGTISRADPSLVLVFGRFERKARESSKCLVPSPALPTKARNRYSLGKASHHWLRTEERSWRLW